MKPFVATASLLFPCCCRCCCCRPCEEEKIVHFAAAQANNKKEREREREKERRKKELVFPLSASLSFSLSLFSLSFWACARFNAAAAAGPIYSSCCHFSQVREREKKNSGSGVVQNKNTAVEGRKEVERERRFLLQFRRS